MSKRTEIPVFDAGTMPVTESFRAADFEAVEMRESVFRRGYVHRVVIGHHCPRCNTLVHGVTRGGTTKCPKCGLRLSLWNNNIEVRGIPGEEGGECD